jgi:hypothetical protein
MAAVMEPSWPGKSTLARVRAPRQPATSARRSSHYARGAPPTSRDAALHTRRSEQFGSIQADRVVTLGESQAGQRALPLTIVRQAIQRIMVLCGDK